MGIEGGGPGGGVLCVGQQSLELLIFLGPVLLPGVKGVREAAPAHIAGQDRLFRRRGPAPLGLNPFQSADGLDVAPELLLGAALTQMVVRDMEVARRGYGGPRPRPLRFAGADGLYHHVIGQVVFLRRIGGHCLGGELRLRRLPRLWPEQPRIALILSQPLLELFPLDRLVAPDIRPSVDADFLFPDVADGAADLMVGRGQRHTVSHLVRGRTLQPYGLPPGRDAGEAVQLLGVQPPEGGGDV